MTYERRRARTSNRVMTVLVVVAIALIAIWAMAGGLEQIPVVDADSELVAE